MAESRLGPCVLSAFRMLFAPQCTVRVHLPCSTKPCADRPAFNMGLVSGCHDGAMPLQCDTSLCPGCSSRDLQDQLNDTSFQISCPGGATTLEVGDSCAIVKDGYSCPDAQCMQGQSGRIFLYGRLLNEFEHHLSVDCRVLRPLPLKVELLMF